MFTIPYKIKVLDLTQYLSILCIQKPIRSHTDWLVLLLLASKTQFQQFLFSCQNFSKGYTQVIRKICFQVASSATVGYYGAKITSADDSSNKETDLDDEDIFIDQRHAIQVHKIIQQLFLFYFLNFATSCVLQMM